MFEHMVQIAEFKNELEAEIASGHLKSAEIGAIILKDDAGGMFPSLQGTEGVRLLVPRAQEEKAKRVLEERKGSNALNKGSG